jgi:glycosyltransferase involved in cell wall biosynthesis
MIQPYEDIAAGRGRKLSIGVNALYLIPGGVGGTEIYLRSLLEALAEIDQTNHYTIYTNRETGDSACPSAQNVVTAIQDLSARSRASRLIWEQTKLPTALKRDHIDVLLNPGYTCPYFAPCPAVSVFHDMQHKRYPEFSGRRDLQFFKLFYWISAHRSSRIIAVSRATKDDMLRYYRLPPSKIKVISHGVDRQFFEIGKQLTQPSFRTILCVSTLHPHKGLDHLVRAFAKWRPSHTEYRLCLAGLEGYYTQ